MGESRQNLKFYGFGDGVNNCTTINPLLASSDPNNGDDDDLMESLFVSQCTSPHSDDTGLPFTDVLIAQIVAPSFQVNILINSSSYKGKEYMGIYGLYALIPVVYPHTVIYKNYSLSGNGQNQAEIKGDTVCSSSVLQDRRPAVGIQDQSQDDSWYPTGAI
eukprot:714819-Ditylum_brightwellii.AAC.1